MVHRFQGQPPSRIRDLFIGVLDAIRLEHNIETLQQAPSHVVGAGASFREVVQNTDWYCWRGDQVQYRPYRYRRYLEALRRVRLPPGNYPVAHVDIGCGAGLFSWAFLDWARDNGLGYGRVSLHGPDHSPEMLNLAHQVRNQLLHSVPDYPNLHYTNDAATLLLNLTEQHLNGTIYIITLGHVLAQVQEQDPDALTRFATTIQHIAEMNAQPGCVLLAVDARQWSNSFASSWSALITNLTAAGIQYEQFSIKRTPINDTNCAKIAVLFRDGGQGG